MAILLLLSILTFTHGYEYRSNLNLSTLQSDTWWGPQELHHEDTSIRRIKLEFSDEVISDLKHRLRHRRPITPSFPGTWFEYGVNSEVVEDWLNYWQNEYPFKGREAVMNSFPHYVTNIQGLDIHFVWIRPEVQSNVDPVPLLYMNGWPSSFVELYGVVPNLVQLSKDKGFALEIIYVTIPGFTLSQAAAKPGLGTPEIGVLVRKLMHRLGHQKYYMASGDFGFFICNFIATVFPEDVLGFHTQIVLLQSIATRINYLLPAFMPALTNSLYVGNNTKGRTPQDDQKQMPYQAQHATIPDTLGMILNDSPTSLLSYMIQMFYWGRVLDRRENMGTRLHDLIPRDQLLDNIMLFWITNSIGTSIRIYAETINRRVFSMNIDETPSPVLTWLTEAKYEISTHSPWMIRTKFPNLVSHKTLDIGGHFYPLEHPELYAEDVVNAVTTFRRVALGKDRCEL